MLATRRIYNLIEMSDENTESAATEKKSKEQLQHKMKRIATYLFDIRYSLVLVLVFVVITVSSDVSHCRRTVTRVVTKRVMMMMISLRDIHRQHAKFCLAFARHLPASTTNLLASSSSHASAVTHFACCS